MHKLVTIEELKKSIFDYEIEGAVYIEGNIGSKNWPLINYHCL